MNKEQLLQKKKEAEDRCRILFDQLQSANQQVEEIKTELERSRGDFRTLKTLVDELSDNLPEEDRHLSDFKKPKK